MLNQQRHVCVWISDFTSSSRAGPGSVYPHKPVYNAENQTKEEQGLFISRLRQLCQISLNIACTKSTSETLTRQKQKKTFVRVCAIWQYVMNFVKRLKTPLLPRPTDCWCFCMSERHYWPWRVCQKVPAERGTTLISRGDHRNERNTPGFIIKCLTKNSWEQHPLLVMVSTAVFSQKHITLPREYFHNSDIECMYWDALAKTDLLKGSPFIFGHRGGLMMTSLGWVLIYWLLWVL